MILEVFSEFLCKRKILFSRAPKQNLNSSDRIILAKTFHQFSNILFRGSLMDSLATNSSVSLNPRKLINISLSLFLSLFLKLHFTFLHRAPNSLLFVHMLKQKLFNFLFCLSVHSPVCVRLCVRLSVCLVVTCV